MKNLFIFCLVLVISASSFSQTKGLNFDGEDDKVSFPYKAGVLTGNAVTFESWVKIAYFSGFAYVVNKGNNGAWFAIIIRQYTNDDLRLPVNDPFISFIVSSTTSYAEVRYTISEAWADQWHHLAGTYNGNKITFYIDGVEVGSQPLVGTIPTNSENLTLGDGPGIGPLACTMDEVRMWNVVRTGAQLQANMNTEIPANTPGLVGYYRMNEGTTDGNNTSITSLTDLAPSPNNGVLENFARTGSGSNFTTGYTSLITLPLKQASFVATRKATTIELNWKQAASDLPGIFDVERSENGSSFTKIGAVASKTGVAETALSFADTKPNQGINYYRLKITEADQRISYSNIVAVRMSGNNAALQIYPVPARNSLQLEINLPKGAVDIQVRNLAGATVARSKANSIGSTLFTSIDVSALSKGTYVVQVNGESSLFLKQ